jgi:dephospho-CoA kinase
MHGEGGDPLLYSQNTWPFTPAKDCVLCTPVYFTPFFIKQRSSRYFWRVIASAKGERLHCDILYRRFFDELKRYMRDILRMPRIIGITGNIACGKTAVGHMLLELGAGRYIDADAVVHKLYQSGQSIAVKVAEAFGPEVVAANGDIDRKALGTIVFQDSAAMRRLEEIVHPAVSQALANELARVSPTDIVIIDAVKLLEGGSGKICQSKWIVICTQELEFERLIARNDLNPEEAWARIKAQSSVEERLPLVDEVIDNSGSLEDTCRQVTAAYERFCKRFPA